MFGKRAEKPAVEEHNKQPMDYEKFAANVDVAPADGHVHDAVFGDLGDDGPNYRNVGTWGGFILMTKANLGLGVLALPTVFSVLGLVPGIICIIVIQSIIAYCALTIGTFKRNHPQVYGLADAGYVFGDAIGGAILGLFGARELGERLGRRIAKEFLYVVFLVFMVFIIGSALVGVATSLNAVSNHATCTAIFVFVAACAGFLFGSIRTLGRISWIGWAGIFSIMASVITLTISVGIQKRPNDVGADWDGTTGFAAFQTTTFAAAMSMINVIVFSYGATPMYFGIVSEMRDVRTYARSMVGSVTFLTVVYIIIGSVVYYYCGVHISSPALGSAGVVMKRVCYGIALPGLCASLTIFAHLCGKTLFVRFLAGSRHLSANTPTSWISWLACVLGAVIVGWIIASAIPIFGSLISLIGALICPMVCILPYNVMWWYDNYYRVDRQQRRRNMLGLVLNVTIFLLGWFLIGAGTYGAVVDLQASTSKNGPWTCENNSGELQ